MTEFTPNGRIPKSDIDALLDGMGSDEWLPSALKGPFFMGVVATIIAILVWLVHGYFLLFLDVETPQTLLNLMWVWLAIIGYSALEMRRLYRLRMLET